MGEIKTLSKCHKLIYIFNYVKSCINLLKSIKKKNKTLNISRERILINGVNLSLSSQRYLDIFTFKF